jgi:tetratricopeptide (TPR) repeat protein
MVAGIGVMLGVSIALMVHLTHPTPHREPGRDESPSSKTSFVGANTCGGCHEHELKLWKGSHHQLAMQPATDSTVLGDFSGVSLARGRVVSRFFRLGSKFVVRTDGPDDALHDYEIKYTFGVSPLQQYLIDFPGGRLQALDIAWDSRPLEQGGQRWFHLYPDKKMAARDPLHWTGLNHNWNFMCADCHSTNLRKNYDLQTRTFNTSYAELNVACEACHGPGSKHVAWAKSQRDSKQENANKGLLIALDKRRDVTWTIDSATGNARRRSPRASAREIQVCARCHSRRELLHEDYVHGQPVEDDYRVALLDENLYFPDGQFEDEVYEYGSFIQSRMFHAGVTCSDCHEPHALKLRAEGNHLCLQCHSAPKYDSPAHHFHRAGSRGAQCIECHMPARTYMVVDARRDHSIRIPRPDLSLRLGTPNACNNCHTDKSAKWAAASVEKWYGQHPEGFQRFGEALHAGSIDAPGARQLLEQLIANRGQPAIARATALALMAGHFDSVAEVAEHEGAVDQSPLVRRAAARALSGVAPRASADLLSPLLNDPVRSVRIEAAEVVTGTPRDGSPTGDSLPTGAGEALGRAIDEYVAAQELNADRPEAHLNLALLFVRQKQYGRAKVELDNALSLDPAFAPAAVNLADLDRELGREDEGERILIDALGRSPGDGSLEHALGLLLVRERREPEALAHLAAAAQLDPANARFAYVYAVALNGAGQTEKAIDVLEDDVRRHPYDRDSLTALAQFYSDTGNQRRALAFANRLAQVDPDNPQVRQLLSKLTSEIKQ